jgi:catechol 2,3-dioxygenase-like lactoylglutathione lyase family enzyme
MIFSHITLGTNDLKSATIFYAVVLEPLGIGLHSKFEGGVAFAPLSFEGVEPPFVVMHPIDGMPGSAGNGTQVSFSAPSRWAVNEFHKKALSAGATSQGSPGIRKHYHPNFFGAYVRDLDGNKICAVCHASVD